VIDAVLEFWFGTGLESDDEPAHFKRIMRWFRGGEGMDREIEARFRSLWEAARRGEHDDWATTPRGRLALILVLDQFSRNLARGTPDAFAQDAKALPLALEAMDRPAITDGMAIWECQFIAVVGGHSEILAVQEKSVAWLERMIAERAPAQLRGLYEKSLGQARGHRDVIRKYGRHPARNAILGRESTPDELEYLKGVPVHLREIR
jgi:uncharacterized protein (DUF924 family)